ncbi:MAG: SpoIIE family protein phosphatase [Spartobacteria bacterium]
MHTVKEAANFESLKENMPHRKDVEILVVDDDALTRQMLTRTIGAGEYKCDEASGGMVAWQRVHAKQYSLLLLDFDMPELNGAELLKRLRSDPNRAVARIPTIMLTGHADEESEVSCLEAGADDFVTKPINIPILRARIETQLRLRHMRRQVEQQNEELEAWRDNTERDLEAARLTQYSLIPQKPMQLGGWDIASYFRPVIQVGGDIYGWLPMKDGRILFWIADATGHGASAALLTTLAKLLFHHGSAEHAAPAAIMDAVNNDFRGIFGARQFMTAMCVALDQKTGKASVLGAGHPPLLVVRADGGHELIRSTAPPLGLADRSQFTEKIVDLAKGDLFVLYTDGLYGGSKGGGARLTPEQLGILIDINAPTAEALLMQCLKQVAPFDENGSASDDIAAIAVRRTA